MSAMPTAEKRCVTNTVIDPVRAPSSLAIFYSLEHHILSLGIQRGTRFVNGENEWAVTHQTPSQCHALPLAVR